MKTGSGSNLGSGGPPGKRRATNLCGHTILQSGLCIVPDTSQDERFADNPMVAGAPRIRFYAGAPLVTAEG